MAFPPGIKNGKWLKTRKTDNRRVLAPGAGQEEGSASVRRGMGGPGCWQQLPSRPRPTRKACLLVRFSLLLRPKPGASLGGGRSARVSVSSGAEPGCPETRWGQGRWTYRAGEPQPQAVLLLLRETRVRYCPQLGRARCPRLGLSHRDGSLRRLCLSVGTERVTFAGCEARLPHGSWQLLSEARPSPVLGEEAGPTQNSGAKLLNSLPLMREAPAAFARLRRVSGSATRSPGSRPQIAGSRDGPALNVRRLSWVPRISSLARGSATRPPWVELLGRMPSHGGQLSWGT